MGASFSALANNTEVQESGKVAVGLGLVSYVLSCITGNDSWVDRQWSIVPAVFAWLYVNNERKETSAPQPLTARVLFAGAITVWAARLTYNFWRRGGYHKGGEDYRWETIRKWPVFQNRIVWHAFSFGFISMFQQILLWGLTLPLISALPKNVAPSTTDYAAAAAALAFVGIETVADQQQWTFQQSKRRLLPKVAALADDYKRGFCTHGLFQISRHPNVVAEQCIWASVAAAAVARQGWASAWPSALGYAVLVALMGRAAVLTEELSAQKYPLYKKYQQCVWMLYPLSFTSRKNLDAFVPVN